MSPGAQWYLLWVVLNFVVCCHALTACLHEGLYAHPTDCAKYFSCAPHGPTLMNCPAGLHFNPQSLACDWPERAGCKGAPPLADEAGYNTCPIYPHPTDCANFYVCAPWGHVMFHCPFGLHYNHILRVCDWPQNVECSRKPVEATSVAFTTIEAVIVTTEKTSTANNLMGASTINETATEMATTTTTSTDDGSTEETMASTTKKVTLTTNVEGFTEEMASTTAIDDQEVTLPTYVQSADECYSNISPHPTDPKQFQMLTPIGTITLTCPDDLWFNPDLLVCDLATSPDLCQAAIWPHRTDCTKFYRCDSTGPIETACPEKLGFNSALLACDWLGNFECQSQPAPSLKRVVKLDQSRRA